MQLVGSIDLPAHIGQGGFDHAAVHVAGSRLYVAHTANDALDVIDSSTDRYLSSVPGLAGVAGALVAPEHGLVFTSNRGDDTVGIFSVGDENNVTRVKVGVRPNGLAFDPKLRLLLAANVGNPQIPDSFTISMVDVQHRALIHSIPAPGRTRWTVFDPAAGCFYVNIADPSRIAVIESARPTRIARSLAIPSEGPHGLDFDPATDRLFCACDSGKLFALEAPSGKVLLTAELSGAPDVVFFNPARRHLYVAVGDPGVIELFETDALKRLAAIPTEKGAHTIGFDPAHSKVYAFLPVSHRATVYIDE